MIKPTTQFKALQNVFKKISLHSQVMLIFACQTNLKEELYKLGIIENFLVEGAKGEYLVVGRPGEYLICKCPTGAEWM